MTRYHNTVWCNGCGAEITWGAVVVGNRLFCCQDCFRGRPCHCGERMDSQDERRSNQSANTYAHQDSPLR